MRRVYAARLTAPGGVPRVAGRAASGRAVAGRAAQRASSATAVTSTTTKDGLVERISIASSGAFVVVLVTAVVLLAR